MQTFIMDLMIIFFLGFVIFYCWQLNGKFTSLKEMNMNLGPSLKTLAEFTNKFSSHLGQFKEQMKEARTVLKEDLPKVESVKEDLELVLEFCENATKRLETLIEDAKKSQHDLDETFLAIKRVLPKNFHEIMQDQKLAVDFDALKEDTMLNIPKYKGAYMVPQKLDGAAPLPEDDLFIDDHYKTRFENLH